VGLAPLLDLPFNRARSHTKFFDVTRCGAVGIYAADSACGELVEHGNDGWVCPMEEQAWVEAVLRLAGDDGLRERLLLGARNKEQRLCDAARGFC
jgi:glycosyltransferase involved in cell wall biosynthesis